jgi:UTP-glucose-1-phosphate uridylyltransferase
MATKADFTETEWEAMEKGISGAGVLVAISDRGFFDTFKEANALAKHLAAAHAQSESELVRELASKHSNPFGVTASPQEIEQGTVDSLHAAVAALGAKAPDDLPAYRKLVLDVAQSVAEAAKGVAPTEATALETVKTAVGA